MSLLDDIQFVWPWVLALAALPICALLVRPKFAPEQPLAVPRVSAFEFEGASRAIGWTPRNLLRWILIAMVWTLIVVALARPQLTGDLVALTNTGRDMLIAVDVSGSMRTDDMQIGNRWTTRFESVQAVVSEFLKEREGDRVGLLLFADQPYVYVPLTADLDTVRQLLLEAPVEIAGTQTAIGDTIGLAVKRLRDRPATQRTLVLLTDGVQNTGGISVAEAAQLAAEMQIRIHTIGFGGSGSNRGFLFMSRSGRTDFSALEHVSQETGGQFFTASDTSDLARVYETINEIEAIEQDSDVYRPIKALFYVPLAIAVVILAVLLLSRRFSHG